MIQNPLRSSSDSVTGSRAWKYVILRPVQRLITGYNLIDR
jgi:hypothetical protein